MNGRVFITIMIILITFRSEKVVKNLKKTK